MTMFHGVSSSAIMLAVSVLATPSAFAADLPSRQPAPAPVLLGKASVYASTWAAFGNTALRWDADATAHIVRVGLNDKF